MGGAAGGPLAKGLLEPSETTRSRMCVAHQVRRRSSVSVQVYEMGRRGGGDGQSIARAGGFVAWFGV